MCDIVKAWLCRGSGIWPKSNVTRIQGPVRTLVSFTLQRNLCAKMPRTRLTGYIHRSQPVQVDRLVSYPFVFIHLRYKVLYIVNAKC